MKVGANPQAMQAQAAEKLQRAGKEMQEKANAMKSNEPTNLTPKVQSDSKLNINA